MINPKAPIIPWEGMGEIKLYSPINKFYDILSQPTTKAYLFGNFYIRYQVNDTLYLWFNLMNGKLFKITALGKYTGSTLNNLHLGMPIDEVLKIDPSFLYDDFEEVYCSPSGLYIETDPIDNTVLWISVFVKEIESENFERGMW